jgi:hypothetical protein
MGLESSSFGSGAAVVTRYLRDPIWIEVVNNCDPRIRGASLVLDSVGEGEEDRRGLTRYSEIELVA